MNLPPYKNWTALSIPERQKIVNSCKSNTAFDKSTSKWCDLVQFMPDLLYYADHNNWSNVLTNDARDYHNNQHPLHVISSTQLTNSTTPISSLSLDSTLQRCYDDYWCPPLDAPNLTIAHHISLGVLGLVLCFLGLMSNLVFIPVFNLIGIASSATVFLIILTIVDCLWIVLTMIMTVVIYLSPSSDGQLIMYQSVQAYLVPLMWPFHQVLEALTLWLLFCLLLDRCRLLRRHTLNMAQLHNQSRPVKMSIIVIATVSFVSLVKCARYRVVDNYYANPDKDMNSKYLESRIVISSLAQSTGFEAYLIVSKIFVDLLLPVLLLLLGVAYSVYRLHTLMRTNSYSSSSVSMQSSGGSSTGVVMPVPRSGLGSEDLHTDASAGGASLPLGGSTDMTESNHYSLLRGNIVSSSCDRFDDLSVVGPFLWPTLSSRGIFHRLQQKCSRNLLKDLKREDKIRLREGVFTQLTLLITATVLVLKIPYFVKECGLLSSSTNSYRSYTFINLTATAEMCSLLSLLVKPVIYWCFAPMLRHTLEDMVRLWVQPQKKHNIHLSGGMGLHVAIASQNKSMSDAQQRSGSFASSCNSLSMLRRNSTVMSLVNQQTTISPWTTSSGGFYAKSSRLMSSDVVDFSAEMEYNVERYVLTKQAPFLADGDGSTASADVSNLCSRSQTQLLMGGGDSRPSALCSSSNVDVVGSQLFYDAVDFYANSVSDLRQEPTTNNKSSFSVGSKPIKMQEMHPSVQ